MNRGVAQGEAASLYLPHLQKLRLYGEQVPHLFRRSGSSYTRAVPHRRESREQSGRVPLVLLILWPVLSGECSPTQLPVVTRWCCEILLVCFQKAFAVRFRHRSPDKVALP